MLYVKHNEDMKNNVIEFKRPKGQKQDAYDGFGEKLVAYFCVKCGKPTGQYAIKHGVDYCRACHKGAK